MSSKSNLRRATLLRNLERLIENIPTLDLPVKVGAIYAFGGILREKDRLHDCDILVLYSMTQEQTLRWDKFRANFSTYGLGSDHNRHPIYELRKIFEPFIEREISLHKAVSDDNFSALLKRKGIPPVWAGCFSWTELLRGPHGDGIFHPSLERVILRLLLGQKMKGLQVLLENYSDYENGHSGLAAKNFVLAWSPDRPNVKENIKGRSPEARKETILKELDHFVNEEIPSRRNGTELHSGYLKAKAEAIKHCAEVNLRIDLRCLDNQHLEIKWRETDSIAELSQKCEIARIELRKYDWETRVLEEIPGILELWKQLRQESSYKEASIEEFATQCIFERIRKKEVKEDDLRSVLKLLKLPEHKIVTIRGYRFTYYRLAKNETERIKLLKEAQKEKLQRKYMLAINKAIKPLEKDVSVHLILDENNMPKSLGLTTYKQIDQKLESQRIELAKNLELSGFKIDVNPWGIYGTKKVNLNGKENIKQLQVTAKNMLLDR
ncbi:MAG: hypothetical protein ABSA75_11500 [Candidatus Bathyarchaeia archaeon]|jgi:hypothetical protein